ncbi:MAG: GH39 family glycosyl hydrolase [Thalassotalea sp.]
MPKSKLALSASLPPADITLQADFSKPSDTNATVFDFFDVSVRTERASRQSMPATFGRPAKVNTVRMLGGWANKDESADTYKWDGEKFVYDFEQATKRIDSWLNNDWDIFQIVLDNPPWAFQRGLTFVDEPDGKHYLQKDANGVYGNGLPPADAQAWHRYMQAFIQHLVSTYGKEKVLSWRFRVGSEIDTRPQHWSATRQEFFDHYQNTVTAVHSILPEAKIGAHFREGSFKGKYLDYTGNAEDSYAPHFVSWAKQNNVAYDFLAISYYPHIDKTHELDMAAVYHHDIAPIQQHPDWNNDASFEIHEYKFIIKMKRAGFHSVRTSHASAFFAMLAKMMLEKNIKEVFQWGTANEGNYNPEALTQLALYPMVGNQLFSNTVSGKASVKGNLVDGIFTKQPNKSAYDIVLFNFNKENLNYQQAENTAISLSVAQATNTEFQYRIGSIDRNNYIDHQFALEFPKATLSTAEGGWRKPDAHISTSAMNALNEHGKKIYRQHINKYTRFNDLRWSDWQTSKTLKAEAESNKSVVLINTAMPSFAVQKIEVRFAEKN